MVRARVGANAPRVDWALHARAPTTSTTGVEGEGNAARRNRLLGGRGLAPLAGR